MKYQPFAILCASLTITGDLCAEGLGYQDTPIIPGTPYHVHDGERPQPRIIETAGAVVVKPPSDAKVLFATIFGCARSENATNRLIFQGAKGNPPVGLTHRFRRLLFRP